MKLEQYTEDSLDLLRAFSERYRSVYPDAKFNAAEFYTYHPAMMEPGNAWCVKEGDRIVAFAPLFPMLTVDMDNEPQDIWTIIAALPDDPQADAARAVLLDAVKARGHDLREEFGKQQVRIGSDLIVSQTGEIDFLRAHGFETIDHLYIMERSTKDAIPDAPVPDDIFIEVSKLRELDEQVTYLKLHNSCFPRTPKTLDDLQFQMSSPAWLHGRVLLAKSEGQIVGAIMIFPGDQGDAIVDDVMVLPIHRGRGISKSLIAVGLRYLASRKFDSVSLEVLVDNAPAVSVYRFMGFEKINEEILLGKVIP